MASLAKQIGDALVSDLTALGATTDPTFTPVYLVVPSFKLEELESLRVTVSPREDLRERADRKSFLRRFGLDVALHRRLAGDPASAATAAELDKLLVVAQQIADRLEGRALPALSDAFVESANVEVVADAEALRERGLFISVIRARVFWTTTIPVQ